MRTLTELAQPQATESTHQSFGQQPGWGEPRPRVRLLVLLLTATAVLLLGLALVVAASAPLMAAGFVLAAAVAEVAGGAARREQTFQLGVALILLAALLGHGEAATLVAATVLAARFIQERRRSLLEGAGAVYILATAPTWVTGSLFLHLGIGLGPGSLWALPNALAITLAWFTANLSLVTLLTLLESPATARLRLRQHGQRLLRRYVAIGLGIWLINLVCELFLSNRFVLAILSTVVVVAVVASRAHRRRQRARAQLYALTVASEEKDHETAAHMRRVGAYAEQIAGELGLADVAVERIGIAAQLHDLGKVGAPAGLLRFDGPLTPEMRREMQQHALLGEQLLTALAGIPEAASAAGGHHERWDGHGYPRGLAGAAVPLAGRITSVADTWDAMRSDRPYRAALPEEQAWAELQRGSGSQFDPAVVAAFQRLRGQRPTRWGLLNPSDTAPLVC